MANATHTVGPWVIRLNGKGQPIGIESRADCHVPGGVGAIVRRNGIGFPSSFAALANARLIAAAPDLLAMCKTLADELNRNGVDNRIPDAYPLDRSVSAGALRELMTVIAKAEGRSHD